MLQMLLSAMIGEQGGGEDDGEVEVVFVKAQRG